MVVQERILEWGKTRKRRPKCGLHGLESLSFSGPGLAAHTITHAVQREKTRKNQTKKQFSWKGLSVIRTRPARSKNKVKINSQFVTKFEKAANNNHSINRSINRSINQPTMTQSINQSINWSNDESGRVQQITTALLAHYTLQIWNERECTGDSTCSSTCRNSHETTNKHRWNPEEIGTRAGRVDFWADFIPIISKATNSTNS